MEITRNPLPLSALVVGFPQRGLVIQPKNGDESGFDSGRCHSLWHYGKVKDPTVENLLPDFDFDHTVGKRLASTGGTRYRFRWLVSEEGGESGFGDDRGQFGGVEARLSDFDFVYSLYVYLKAGHTAHIAVLMRLDIEESSVDSIYITVWGLWASPYLPLHMGKTGKRTDNARRTFWPSVAGFTVSKIVSKADQALNKWRQNEKKRKQSDPKVSVPAESPILIVGADSNSY
uniref:Uncharacterized protein n=1 Tax=Quercus lobata TaxID=97700 RepID=A0A7N2KLL0_QUELO